MDLHSEKYCSLYLCRNFQLAIMTHCSIYLQDILCGPKPYLVVVCLINNCNWIMGVAVVNLQLLFWNNQLWTVLCFTRDRPIINVFVHHVSTFDMTLVRIGIRQKEVMLLIQLQGIQKVYHINNTQRNKINHESYKIAREMPIILDSPSKNRQSSSCFGKI